MTAMAARRAEKGAPSRPIVLGACLLVCLLLGGATQRGLLVDAVLQVTVIAGSAYVLLGGGTSGAARRGSILLMLVLLAGGMQLLPLPISLLELSRPAQLLPFAAGSPTSPSEVAPLSLSVSRTVETVLFALAPVLFFIAASSLPSGNPSSLLPFFLIGLFCNLIAAILQYSVSSNATLGDIFGYSVMVGMFANVNHFSTLVFSGLPLIIHLTVHQGRPAIGSMLLALMLVVLLAAGSRAGMLIGLGVAAISVGSLTWRGRVGAATTLVLLAGLVAYGYGALIHAGARPLDPDFGRREFATTTWHAIRDNWIWGTGFGTFDLIYPLYADTKTVNTLYVNHAHNDFLELLLEGGLSAATLLCFYFATLAMRTFRVTRPHLQRMALLSIIVILLHSLVDYPLRTMAIAMTFAFFNALFFSDANSTWASRDRESKNVGPRLPLPVDRARPPAEASNTAVGRGLTRVAGPRRIVPFSAIRPTIPSAK